MKKFVTLLTAILFILSLPLAGCGKKQDESQRDVAPQSVDEPADDAEETDHSDFKFVPKPLNGKGVYHQHFDGGEIVIIRFGNRKRVDGEVCPHPPQKPNLPDDSQEN